MRNIDFSSWQTMLSTLMGLAVVSLIAVGIRLILMQTVQQRRERENRQINERLRTLIAAYKTLGGSFTGDLDVDPTHLRDLRLGTINANATAVNQASTSNSSANESSNSDRSRRIRDAVEAALSDVILLGTEQQVELAAKAATDLASGRSVHTDDLVISLRNFIREVLDLEAVPRHLSIPKQGPARPSASRASGSKQEGSNNNKGGTKNDGDGGGMGTGVSFHAEDDPPEHH